MDCKQAKVYFDAYLDDELSAEKIIQIQLHLDDCESCFTEVELAREVTRLSQTAVDNTPMCEKFRERLELCLHQECEAIEKREHTVRTHLRPLSWRVIAPLTAAAAFILTLGFMKDQPGIMQPLADKPTEASVASAADTMMDYLVSHHSQPSTPKITEKTSLADSLEKELGFPVRVPHLERYGARFVGAGIVTINGTRAASLQYLIAGRRVTFYVYNPEEMPLRANSRLSPQVVGDRAVFVGKYHGYSVAAMERAGIGYLVTADLPSQESMEMIAAIDTSN